MRMSTTTDLSSMLNADDLKFLISIIDYSLFACPIDVGIEKGDGGFATREDFENLQKRTDTDIRVFFIPGYIPDYLKKPESK